MSWAAVDSSIPSAPAMSLKPSPAGMEKGWASLAFLLMLRAASV
jgi:hypothetical protein